MTFRQLKKKTVTWLQDQQGQTVGLLYSAAAGVVLVAAIAWMWAGEKLGADFCPAKTEKHILVLHDGTTRLHEHALQSVTYQIDRIKNALQPENRLTLLTLTSPALGLVSE